MNDNGIKYYYKNELYVFIQDIYSIEINYLKMLLIIYKTL